MERCIQELLAAQPCYLDALCHMTCTLYREMGRSARGTTASPAPATWMSAALPPIQGGSMQDHAMGSVKRIKGTILSLKLALFCLATSL
jgi:hypothetical protein